jgi:hypothetical protein
MSFVSQTVAGILRGSPTKKHSNHCTNYCCHKHHFGESYTNTRDNYLIVNKIRRDSNQSQASSSSSTQHTYRNDWQDISSTEKSDDKWVWMKLVGVNVFVACLWFCLAKYAFYEHFSDTIFMIMVSAKLIALRLTIPLYIKYFWPSESLQKSLFLTNKKFFKYLLYKL